MSGSDGSADSDHEPEAEAGAGKGEVEVASSGDDTVKVVSKPLGGRVAASKAAAGFVTCQQSNCILYKKHGWLRHVDKERALCPTCKVPVPCKNSNTSNLWRHWKKSDRKAHDAAKNTQDKASAARPRQQTLSFKANRQSREKQLRAVSGFVILDQQPFNVVEAPSFRHLLETYSGTVDPVHVPSRRQVTERVEEMSIGAVETLTDILKPLWPAITTDNWTSNTGDPYMAFTANFIKEGDTEVTSVVLSCEPCPGSHTAELLAEKTKACLEKFGISDRAVTLTTDTAANIKKAGTQLLDQEWHACAAHVIQLSIKPVFNEPSVKATLEKHNKMATHLHASTKSRDKLTTLQKEAGKTMKVMPLNCVTRWNSQYVQAVFAEKNRLQIESTLEFAKSFPRGPSLTYEARDWENTDAIVNLLKVMSRAVTVLQGNFITNSMMPMLSNTLHAFYMRKATVIGELPDHIQIVAMAMFDQFGDRFEVCTDAAKIASFLDPRTKSMWWADEYEPVAFRALVVQAVVKMATYEEDQRAASMANAPGGGGGGGGEGEASTPSAGAASGSSGGDAEEVDVSGRKRKVDNLETDYSLLFKEMLMEAELTRDLEGPPGDTRSGGESDDAASRVTLAEFEVSRFMREKEIDYAASSRDVLTWWLVRRNSFPTLYKVACVYLAVPATSAASERVFSNAGNVITKKRNRLSPENAHNLVFLHGCHPVGWKLGEEVKLSSEKSGSSSKVAAINVL